MIRRILFLACGGGLLTAMLQLGAGLSRAPAEAEPKGATPFGPTRIWTIHVNLSAKEYDGMQPAAPAFPGAPQPKNDDKQKRASDRNLFGTELPWAEGDVILNGKTFEKAALRYGGDITYLVSARGAKRPLLIRFAKEEAPPGLGSVALQSMPLDAAKGRAVLASSIFQAAGVPTPRAAFAEVTLTVPGKFDKELLGLYAAVEGVDATFLTDRFGSDKGLLMKPFGMRGLDFLGDDWARYEKSYRPLRAATKEESRRVIDFARLINQASDDEFAKDIDSFLDVDAFLRFQAANALTSNLHSFLALGHNYYLYLNPKTNKFVFIPDDLEFSCANFLLMGTPEQLIDVSLLKPYPGENKLPDRLLARKEIKDRYEKLLRALTEKAFLKEKLLETVTAIDKATADLRAREAKAVAARREPPARFGAPGNRPAAPDLKTFIEKRSAAVADQLAGKSKGYLPERAAFAAPVRGPQRGNAQAIDEQTFRTSVQVPPGFEATLFAAPPQVSYPVALAAAPTGEVYVAVDEQGSLGRTPGG
ncbi:MAG: CotH kinase family protein, partial [Gemmataceae bacterium]